MTKIEPHWPISQVLVGAFTTTRTGGVSPRPYDSFNLGGHVGDLYFQQNRVQLNLAAELEQPPSWLNQTHSSTVIPLTSTRTDAPNADAAYTSVPGIVAVVMTADCLPLLVYDAKHHQVAAIHAGWRGLADGIIEKTLSAIGAEPDVTYIWMGPAISQPYFEVGQDVYHAFCDQDNGSASDFAAGKDASHWMADIYALAKRRCQKMGFTMIYGGEHCTYADSQRFYSYRRDGQTGRMASLIWLK